MDDVGQRPVFEKLCHTKPVELFVGAQDAPQMSPESRVILRQASNLTHAIEYLLPRGTTWLLHIDIDEILWEGGDISWESSPDIGCPFHDCVGFKVNGKLPFMAYGNGKSAVRLARGISPDGPHKFQGYQGKCITLSVANGPVVLHYPCQSFEAWVAKFKQYGKFSNYWFDESDKPNLITFMLQSRDHVQRGVTNGDWGPARDFYGRMILDEETCRKSAAIGNIRRYAPFEQDGIEAKEEVIAAEHGGAQERIASSN